ncbi:MAG: enoyl-CoA hydratase-related protein [Chloroflexi bacterium]|nr:enoyl-CoA hydratase-related protein [Chloroflexota bacterium]
MEYEGLILEKKNRVAILTMNRPQRLNALTAEISNELMPRIFREIQEDDEVRALIITGAGKGFCTGADIVLFNQAAEEGKLQETLEVIAAVNGVAAGGGVSLALLSDIRIASERAIFNLAFVMRGLIPDCGCTFLMPRLLGTGRCYEYMYTGDSIDAREAERIGMVNRVVPHEKLMEEAEALANRIVQGPPLALKQIKRAVQNGLINTLEQQLYFETYAQKFLMGSEDFREGLDSFRNKRLPQFKGR